MNPLKSWCISLLAALLPSVALSAPPTLMGLGVGDSWAVAAPKLKAACASLKGCDLAQQSYRPSAGDWFAVRLADKVDERECTRLEVDFVRKGRTLLINEIAVTSLCASEDSSTAAEQKLTARFGPYVDKKVQSFRPEDDKLATNLLWSRSGLSLADVLSNERMQHTVPRIYLRTPKEGATYLFASIDSSKANGTSSVVSLVLTHGSLTSLRHERMVQAHARAAMAAPPGSPGS